MVSDTRQNMGVSMDIDTIDEWGDIDELEDIATMILGIGVE
jgi:hypothetical protein